MTRAISVRFRCDFGAISVRIAGHRQTPLHKEKPPQTGASSVWRCLVWWSWRELNPRPQAFTGQIYMFSGLI